MPVAQQINFQGMPKKKSAMETIAELLAVGNSAAGIANTVSEIGARGKLTPLEKLQAENYESQIGDRTRQAGVDADKADLDLYNSYITTGRIPPKELADRIENRATGARGLVAPASGNGLENVMPGLKQAVMPGLEKPTMPGMPPGIQRVALTQQPSQTPAGQPQPMAKPQGKTGMGPPDPRLQQTNPKLYSELYAEYQKSQKEGFELAKTQDEKVKSEEKYVTDLNQLRRQLVNALDITDPQGGGLLDELSAMTSAGTLGRAGQLLPVSELPANKLEDILAGIRANRALQGAIDTKLAGVATGGQSDKEGARFERGKGLLEGKTDRGILNENLNMYLDEVDRLLGAKGVKVEPRKKTGGTTPASDGGGKSGIPGGVIQAGDGAPKTVVKKFRNKKTGQIKVKYSDGSEAIE